MIAPTPAPNAHHRALAALEGRFRGTERPRPGGDGEPPIGTYDIRLGLGGFGLFLEYEQLVAGVRRYAMHGVIGWEPAEERYYFHWYDSLGGLGTGMRGRLEDATFVFEGPDPVQGGRARFTFDPGVTTGDGFDLTMAFSADGETWNEAMAARYNHVH